MVKFQRRGYFNPHPRPNDSNGYVWGVVAPRVWRIRQGRISWQRRGYVFLLWRGLGLRG